MPELFLEKLCRDFSRLFEGSENYDVVIRVGAGNDIEEFRAHSVVLCARCNYFALALSKKWVKIEDNGIMVFEKPNMSPKICEMILKYLYIGFVSLEHEDLEAIFEFLDAIDELNIEELIEYSQDFLLREELDWLKDNMTQMYGFVDKHIVFEKLKNFCCEYPKEILVSEKCTSLSEEAIVALLKSPNMKLPAVEIWNHVLRWATAQPLNVENSKQHWTSPDIDIIKQNVSRCLPLIKFDLLSPRQFFDYVRPFRQILPEDVYQRLSKHRVTPEGNLIIDSMLINGYHSELLASWISGFDAAKSSAKQIPFEFRLLVRGSRDGFLANTFRQKCNNLGPTVVVMRVKGHDRKIIGGYNPFSWGSNNLFQKTRESFLFSFGCPTDASTKNKLCRVKSFGTGSKAEYAVCDRPDYGPGFGSMDLAMHLDFEGDDGCECDHFAYEQQVFGKKRVRFGVDEYEVFQVVKISSGGEQGPRRRRRSSSNPLKFARDLFFKSSASR